jgi:hypothetical protein
MIKRTAVVLIDLENQADLSLEALRGQLRQRFYLIGQLAFADYSRPSLRSVASRLGNDGVTRVHVDTSLPQGLAHTYDGAGARASGSLPNGVDHVMAKILDCFAGRDYVAAIVVVSGDNYFAQHVKRARRMGKRVIVAANPDRTGRRLLDAASEFISLHRVQN